MTLLPTPFDQFWAAWPSHKRKTSKQKCRARWKRDKLDGKFKHIIKVLKSLKASDDWRKDSGKYIPSPLVWLNQARWDCDIEDLPGKRSKECNTLARGIATSSNATYGPDGKRANEMMRADPGYTQLRKLRELQKATGNAKMSTWQCYIYLAKQEREAQE